MDKYEELLDKYEELLDKYEEQLDKYTLTKMLITTDKIKHYVDIKMAYRFGYIQHILDQNGIILETDCKEINNKFDDYILKQGIIIIDSIS